MTLEIGAALVLATALLLVAVLVRARRASRSSDARRWGTRGSPGPGGRLPGGDEGATPNRSGPAVTRPTRIVVSGPGRTEGAGARSGQPVAPVATRRAYREPMARRSAELVTSPRLRLWRNSMATLLVVGVAVFALTALASRGPGGGVLGETSGPGMGAPVTSAAGQSQAHGVESPAPGGLGGSGGPGRLGGAVAGASAATPPARTFGPSSPAAPGATPRRTSKPAPSPSPARSPRATPTARITPTVRWPTPADVVYGTPLTPVQLDATANVAGTFTYTPALGTVLHAGAGQTLRVTFTPADGAAFTGAGATVSITVLRAIPVITWTTPTDIMTGTPLSSAQLDASADVPGSFAYSPPDGTVLAAGPDQALSVTFHPDDALDYTTATASVTITVQ